MSPNSFFKKEKMIPRTSDVPKVTYGTSDALINFAEALLTYWVAEEVKARPVYTYYPKASIWDQFEKSLFAPYPAPSSDIRTEIRQLLGTDMEVTTIQEMARQSNTGQLTLKKVATLIREKREIQSFRALTFVDGRKVYVSTKDRYWRKCSEKTIEEILGGQLKLGGAFIYFIFGAYAAKYSEEAIAILPRKLLPDVIGAFKAGQEYIRKEARVITTGEFDVMTRCQWEAYERDKKWRKAPFDVVKRLLEDTELTREVKERLLRKQSYVALEYDEAEKRFRFRED